MSVRTKNEELQRQMRDRAAERRAIMRAAKALKDKERPHVCK